MNDPGLTEILVLSAISIIVTYFFLRWMFSVDTQVKQKSDIIILLMMIATKNGIDPEKINSAVQSDKSLFQRFKDFYAEKSTSDEQKVGEE